MRHDATRLAEIVLIAVIAVSIALFSLFRFGPLWMDADTSILTVMSAQQPTLFFWGETASST